MTALPGIFLPPTKRLTDEERRQRQVLYEQTKRLREEIGPIDIPTYELVREGRDE
jgi:hypothetical protein